MFPHIAAFRLVTQAPERLATFYKALGFAVEPARPIAQAELTLLGIAGGGMRWPMRLGAAMVDLDCYDTPGRAYPASADAAATCFQHLALVTDDIAIGWAKARSAGATPISRDGPVTLPASSGGVTAIKFRDPEGHPLELLRFPDDKTDRRGSGIPGVDHSAIVVRDLDASIAFYIANGLTPGDATLNEGPEQAALDALTDPVVNVVPMMPHVAPSHVELLHYRQPRSAADTPVDVHDVAATRFVWRGGDAAVVRDPDGHIHQMGG